MGKAKLIIIILALIALGLIVWAAVRPQSQSTPSTATVPTKVANTPQSTAPGAPLKVSQTNVPVTSLPQDFPSDIPLEAGAVVTQNYNATASNGLFQASRVFTSKNTAASNITLYTNFLNSNGWDIVSTLNNNSIKVVSATKAGANLQVSVVPTASNTKTSSVAIDYTIEQ